MMGQPDYVAYLVGIIDLTQHPPVLQSVNIYSEPTPTTDGRRFTFNICRQRSTRSYADAKRRLIAGVKRLSCYSWALELLGRDFGGDR
jgi:hypothetical protein